MNEALVANWNKVVTPDDTVYCLGDFSMSFRSIELFSHRLNGLKFLIPGNHDFCHSYNKKSKTEAKRMEWLNKYSLNGWIVMPEKSNIILSDLGTVELCHHPRAGDFDPADGYDKYASWRPKDSDTLLLCGHVHNTWKTKDRMINVGVDVWDYTPVSLEEIKKLVIS